VCEIVHVTANLAKNIKIAVCPRKRQWHYSKKNLPDISMLVALVVLERGLGSVAWTKSRKLKQRLN
jgi:hypothetical protein